eukprot:CAMPEP_0198544598 /NCGR_PEP_ID=MMETSP1462-20131121/61315_1 /TAXON_ID=1333877 /ORGANISM="Brandtodinium nutriculum, Strain RCC3387" /LENGTH=61 /DNA_ID=CAMNT_0044274935 /DNA_START=56 /DNA_END=241 /DNA_ORIENTATION=+
MALLFAGRGVGSLGRGRAAQSVRSRGPESPSDCLTRNVCRVAVRLALAQGRPAIELERRPL